jgi:inner membrane protein
VPTALSHAVVGAALAPWAPRGLPAARVAAALAASAVLPDLDVVGFALGIPYGHALGHRGITHSLPFAAALGALAAGLARARGPRPALALGALTFLACASHGLLDAATDGGRGVGLLLPFLGDRVFFDLRPIPVSPLEPEAFLGPRGARVLRAEIAALWLPALGVALVGAALRRVRRRGGGAPQLRAARSSTTRRIRSVWEPRQ